MTTGTLPEPVPLAARWAAEQLGVDTHADPETARAAFLRGLQDREFVPPQGWRRALRVLTASPNASMIEPNAEGLRAEYDRLRPEVESFAADFWIFPPAERRRRWNALLLRCMYLPALLARLNALSPGVGLDVSMPEYLVAEPAALASEVKALFVLRPAEQAARRRQLLQRVREAPHVWKAAALELRDGWPALAALQPTLLERVAAEVNAGARYDRLRQTAALESTPTPSQPSGRGGLRIGWVVIVVVMSFSRLMMSLGTSHPPEPYVPPPPQKIPHLEPWEDGMVGGKPKDPPWMEEPDPRKREEDAQRWLRENTITHPGNKGTAR